MFKMCGDINAWQRATKKNVVHVGFVIFFSFFFAWLSCMEAYTKWLYTKKKHMYLGLCQRSLMENFFMKINNSYSTKGNSLGQMGYSRKKTNRRS